MNKEIFKTKEMQSGIKLALWVIFIVVVLVVLSNGSEERNTSNTTSSYEVMWKNILEENYSYKYIINTDINTYIYEGYKCSGQEYGYKESNEGIIKYLVDETGTYSLVMNQGYILDNLYEGDYYLYFDLNYLYDEIKDYSYQTEVDNELETLTYVLSDKEVNVIHDSDNITNINIKRGSDTYAMEFTNIGNCAKIVFTD